MWRSLCLAASLLCMSSTLASAQDGRVVIVLDGSNSMWGRVGDVEKIVVARQVLTDVLADVPPGLDVGLAAYGHRRAGACDDIETLLAPGRHPRVDVERAIRGVQPTGLTPITAALQAVVEALPPATGATHVVLVSDGRETCGGDPCALVRTLRERRADLTVHVVGFDVADDEREQLQCLAEAGGGVYTGATTAAELTAALQSVRARVIEATDSAAASAASALAAATADREGPYWIVRTGDETYEGDLSFVHRRDGQLAVQLFNRDAVNVGFLAPGDLNGGPLSDTFLVIGRGTPCRLVASESPPRGRWSTDGAWFVGSFSAHLACIDHRGLRVDGAFRIPARESGRD